MPLDPSKIRAAQMVLPCEDLSATVAFFTDRLGFRLDAIHPADDPTVAVLSGYGVCLRLERGAGSDPGALRLLCDERDLPELEASRLVVAPNGTRLELVAADPPLVFPPLRSSFVVTRLRGDEGWVEGRAGMVYRDLIPDRQGGRFIASHIRVPAGPVADYVHFHRVGFQLIYCARGWVRVVYEDQGPSFVLAAGDAALQPPGIRHRVLESGPELEVVEVSAPAEHETFVDHNQELPTRTVDAKRIFGGQTFVRHVAEQARWAPWTWPGFEARDLGIGAGTGGLGEAHVVRACVGISSGPTEHDADLMLLFFLRGGATLRVHGHADERLTAGDASVVPRTVRYALDDCTGDLELLTVTVAASRVAALAERSLMGAKRR